MIELKLKRLDERVCLPKQATAGSAGLDLTAVIEKPLTLTRGELYSIPTGLAAEIPQGYAGFVFARSGLAVKFGVTLSNAVGVIDSDYRGEIRVGLVNLSDTPYTVQPFERIAQMIVMPVPPVMVLESDDLGDTARGAGGFGSTGK